MIHYLPREVLEHDAVVDAIYEDLERTHYWSDCWDTDFYVGLARAGFISISTSHPELGPVLIPEMQEGYSILDWDHLHVSRKLRKLLRSERLRSLALELRVVADCGRVLERVVDYHAPECWLEEPYRDVMRALPADGDPHFALHAIELWSTARGELVSGELGYSIGRVYTSLTGFCSRAEREWQHLGTLQLVWLAERLRDSGYAFWNLGQPMAYKRSLGGRVHPRRQFLDRWLCERDRVPARSLLDAAASG